MILRPWPSLPRPHYCVHCKLRQAARGRLPDNLQDHPKELAHDTQGQVLLRFGRVYSNG